MKTFLLAALLSVASLTVASAKSYQIAVDVPAKAGSTQLAKGSYTVQVQGSNAVFTDERNKSVSVPVKLDAGKGKKFEYTSVESTRKDDGTEVIKLIHLGGSTTTIEFGD
jgi:hypothetical protein